MERVKKKKTQTHKFGIKPQFQNTQINLILRKNANNKPSELEFTHSKIYFMRQSYKDF